MSFFLKTVDCGYGVVFMVGSAVDSIILNWISKIEMLTIFNRSIMVAVDVLEFIDEGSLAEVEEKN